MVKTTKSRKRRTLAVGFVCLISLPITLAVFPAVADTPIGDLLGRTSTVWGPLLPFSADVDNYLYFREGRLSVIRRWLSVAWRPTYSALLRVYYRAQARSDASEGVFHPFVGGYGGDALLGVQDNVDCQLLWIWNHPHNEPQPVEWLPLTLPADLPPGFDVIMCTDDSGRSATRYVQRRPVGCVVFEEIRHYNQAMVELMLSSGPEA